MAYIKVWSATIRLIHWGMVGALSTAMWTRSSLFQQMVHVYAGYVMAVLLVLRIVYGFAARDMAAFRQFPPRLAEGTKYFFAFLRGRAQRHLGHNPAAALAIYALLGLGLATVATGYVAFEYDLDLAKDWHHDLAYTLFWLACFHVLSVLVVGWRQREFLVMAMITGYKRKD